MDQTNYQMGSDALLMEAIESLRDDYNSLLNAFRQLSDQLNRVSNNSGNKSAAGPTLTVRDPAGPPVTSDQLEKCVSREEVQRLIARHWMSVQDLGAIEVEIYNGADHKSLGPDYIKINKNFCARIFDVERRVFLPGFFGLRSVSIVQVRGRS